MADLKAKIRRILNQDRMWSAYAIGDLAEPLYSQCQWIVGENALVLIFPELQPPILLTVGSPAEIETLLVDVPLTTYHISIKTDVVAALETRFSVEPQPLVRMVLDATQFECGDVSLATPMTQAHLPQIETLFALGAAAGDMPDGFLAQQLNDGTSFGIWAESGELAAFAGTHLYNPQESVAAVGNVYVHPAHRGQGFGKIVTAKVTDCLLKSSIETVVLNVRQHNATAQRLYSRFGYVHYCNFFEGVCRTK